MFSHSIQTAKRIIHMHVPQDLDRSVDSWVKGNPICPFQHTSRTTPATSSPPSPATTAASEPSAEWGPLALHAGHFIMVVTPFPVVLLTVPVCLDNDNIPVSTTMHTRCPSFCYRPRREYSKALWHHRLTSEVIPGIWREAGVFVLSAVVPGGWAFPRALRLHFNHQGNPFLLVAW